MGKSLLDFITNPIATIATGVLGAGANLIGNSQQNKMIDKQLQAQQEENEKARQFSQQMISEQNAYNSPVNQKAMYQQAGFNPDLLVQSATGMSAQQQTPNYNPNDFGALGSKRSSVAAALGYTADLNQKVAQTELLKQQAENLKSKTSGQKQEQDYFASVAEFRAALEKGQVSLQNVQIENTKALTNLTNDQQSEVMTRIQKANYEMSEIKAKTDQARAHIAYMSEEMALKRIETHIRKNLTTAQIHRLGVENAATLADITYKTILGQNVSMNTYVQGLQGMNVQLQNDRLTFDLSQEQKWQDWERGFKLVESGSKSLNLIVGSIAKGFAGFAMPL